MVGFDNKRDIDVTTNVVAVAAAMLSGIAFIGFLAFSRI